MFICTSPQYKLVNAETAEVSMRWERRGIAAEAVCPNNYPRVQLHYCIIHC